MNPLVDVEGKVVTWTHLSWGCPHWDCQASFPWELRAAVSVLALQATKKQETEWEKPRHGEENRRKPRNFEEIKRKTIRKPWGSARISCVLTLLVLGSEPLEAILFAIGEHLGQSCGHVHIVRLPTVTFCRQNSPRSSESFCESFVKGISTSFRGAFQLVFYYQLCDLDQAQTHAVHLSHVSNL